MKSMYTLLTVALMAALVMAQDDAEPSFYRGFTSKNSFRINSPNNNPWTSGMTTGAFLGFILFGCSYIYVVIYIFYDINRSKHQYLEMVQDDKDTISRLNVPAGIQAEWEEELALRLSGR